MESLRQDTSDAINETKEKVKEASSQWPNILKELVDKLTGKNMQVTYNFDNFEIEVPKVTGPEGKEIGSAKWRIDGKFILSTQLLDKSQTVE
jgi:hypothetical protein